MLYLGHKFSNPLDHIYSALTEFEFRSKPLNRKSISDICSSFTSQGSLQERLGNAPVSIIQHKTHFWLDDSHQQRALRLRITAGALSPMVVNEVAGYHERLEFKS